MPIPKSVKPGGRLTLIIVAVGVAVVLAAAGYAYYFNIKEGSPAEGDNETETAATPAPVEPDAPLKLPVADAAGDPWVRSDPAALINVSAQWNDNVTVAEAYFKETYGAIKRTHEREQKGPPAVTLLMEPDAVCLLFQKALLAGRDAKVWAYNLACIKTPESREVRYVKLALNGQDGREQWVPSSASRIRIRKLRSGDVAWQIDGLLLDTWDKIESLMTTLSKREGASDILYVISPDQTVAVQQYIAVHNLLTKLGLKHIAVGRPMDD